MESRLQDLEERHVSVYRELLTALDELYLLRKGIRPEDETLLAVRHQLQSSLTMTAPMMSAMNGKTALDKRLLKLMQENHKLDAEVAAHQDEKLRLMRELGKERVRYKELVSNAHELTERQARAQGFGGLRTSRGLQDANTSTDREEQGNGGQNSGERDSTAEASPEQRDKSQIERENEALSELLVGMIVHGGYLGTNKLFDEWLERL
ncbi:LAQU0S19e01552g1_1 [Lachancea quebecensis]|uniref:LAQU0S19e01552g1_1 n=1 Tax=Lachancea quebecensis TaxID=1654605 RepID=A0A0P1KZ69_9SACH|nr:LAQU0S19e01552g1_1 [Lachancea quebecensis]